VKVLAIDPGTRYAGYAVIEKTTSVKLINYGLLKLSPRNSLVERIGELGTFFIEKIKEYDINEMCIETPFLFKNAATFLKLGYVRGVLYYIAHNNNIKISEYSPSEVKQAICAKGNATKAQVAQMVYKHFPTLEKDLKDDVTDAISIGLTRLIVSSVYNRYNKSNNRSRNRYTGRNTGLC